MRMYHIIASLVAFSPLCGAQVEQPAPGAPIAASEINWLTDFDKAKAQAASQSKPLFLYFTGSDWCPWCIEMDKKILSTPEFQQALGQKMIFVKIDFPKKQLLDKHLQEQNEKLAQEYGVNGFPTVILLDPNLKQIDTLHYEGDNGATFAKKILDILDAYKEKSPK